MSNTANEADIKELLARQNALEERLAKLTAENEYLRRLLFGKKSEKTAAVVDGQLELFGPPQGEETEESQAAQEPIEVPAHKRKKRRGRQEIPDDLPREEVVIDVPEKERCCQLCEVEMVPFKDAVSERVHLVPASTVVIRTVRKQYRCPDGHHLVSAPAPPELLPRSKYDTSVAVHLVVAKYADHLPLHRQVEILKRVGINIPKSTVCDLVMRFGELMQPVLKEMEQELKSGSYIQSDDTPITVLQEGQKGSKRGHIWIWRCREVVVFRFNFSRGRDGPIAFLGDWKGHLQTDGLSSYSEVVKANELTHHGCWAHVRRKYVDCARAGDEAAAKMVVSINRLFAIEREARDAAVDGNLMEILEDRRRTQSVEVLEELHQAALVIEGDPSVSRAGSLMKAVGYMSRQWDALTRFVEAPEVMIHNNDAERAIRAVAIGRKNWLFAGSPRGAVVAATLYSLIATCKVLELPLDRYLTEVAERLIANPKVDAAELTPWAWAKANDLKLPIEASLEG